MFQNVENSVFYVNVNPENAHSFYFCSMLCHPIPTKPPVFEQLDVCLGTSHAQGSQFVRFPTSVPVTEAAEKSHCSRLRQSGRLRPMARSLADDIVDGGRGRTTRWLLVGCRGGPQAEEAAALQQRAFMPGANVFTFTCQKLILVSCPSTNASNVWVCAGFQPEKAKTQLDPTPLSTEVISSGTFP